MSMKPPIRIAISSCLVGQRVRYDGGDKRNDFITESLGRIFEFVPLCPEVAIGMGVPRPPIQLVRTGRAVHARGVADAAFDVTNRLLAEAERIAPTLRGIGGYILKKNSPSCGMQDVKLFNARGIAVGKTRGIYAGHLQELLPDLPFEEEDRLMDSVLRENFLERVFIYHRWQQLNTHRLTAAGLVEFHARHKFVLLAHDEMVYRALGRLVAGAGRTSVAQVGPRYIHGLMAGLQRPATRARHANVLEHLAGFLKKKIDATDRRELHTAIARYRRGETPRLVPITLLRHHLNRHPDPYLANQYYLEPEYWPELP